MPYGWKIELDGVDVSAKVSRFTVSADRGQFCREVMVDFADPDYFDSLDLANLAVDPRLEVFTRVDTEWVSQGKFFLERPAYRTEVDAETSNGVWGRSAIAAMAKPFAPRVNKTWTEDTTFYAVCAEMMTLCGLTWDSAYCDIDDFRILAYAYQADNLYPIDVVSELAVMAGAGVTTDRAGHLCVRKTDYAPAAADDTLSDIDYQVISEDPEWPDFGNRIRISPALGFAGYGVVLTCPSPCLPATAGLARAKLYARVTDSEGFAVQDIPVSWTSDATAATLQLAASNTRTVTISAEVVRAANYHLVPVAFSPASVIGVWAYSDKAKATNLAAGGYTLDEDGILLTDALEYCDQKLVVDYTADGVAINYLASGLVAEDVTVSAVVEGEVASVEVYIDNPCQCPPTLSIQANPDSIHIGEVARVLVYAEDAGGPALTGRKVFLSEQSANKKGVLSWTSARLGRVDVASEKVTAVNEIAGVSQCQVSMYPYTVESVYAVDESGAATGPDLYDSHVGKVIDLVASSVATGATLLVSYTAVGAALAYFTGAALGTAQITAWMQATREEPLEASATVNVVDESEPTPPESPPGWDDDPGDDPGDDPVDGGSGSGGDPGQWDDDPDPLCEQDDGTKIKCPSGQACCWKGGEFGCFPEAECTQQPLNGQCLPANVSADPNDDALADRFAAAKALGCSCEETCQMELAIFGTTQSYDGASYRTASEIAIEDHGLTAGSPAYWEKRAEIEAAAIEACLAECEDCWCPDGIEWDSDNSATEVAREHECIVAIVADAKCGPFTWSVSGTGFLLESEQSVGPANVLAADETACGTATITVTDCNGGAVTGYVRSTEGQWVVHNELNWNKTTDPATDESCGTTVDGCGCTDASLIGECVTRSGRKYVCRGNLAGYGSVCGTIYDPRPIALAPALACQGFRPPVFDEGCAAMPSHFCEPWGSAGVSFHCKPCYYRCYAYLWECPT